MVDERRLWTAVLEQAIRDLIGVETSTPRYDRLRFRRITRMWFVSNSSETGSFHWICDQLEIDASWLRHRLLTTAGSSRKGTPDRIPITLIEEASMSARQGPHCRSHSSL